VQVVPPAMVTIWIRFMLGSERLIVQPPRPGSDGSWKPS
jgi:hypothetical protein